MGFCSCGFKSRPRHQVNAACRATKALHWRIKAHKKGWQRGDVAKWLRRRSAKPLFGGSNPPVASSPLNRLVPVNDKGSRSYRVTLATRKRSAVIRYHRFVPRWRNGRRGGLKIRYPTGCVGSNPTLGTNFRHGKAGGSASHDFPGRSQRWTRLPRRPRTYRPA